MKSAVLPSFWKKKRDHVLQLSKNYMPSAKVTTKGQITIPKLIRDYLQLEAGSEVDFVLDENGQVKLIPLNVSIESLSGILHRPGMQVATTEEMEKAIQEAASDWD